MTLLLSMVAASTNLLALVISLWSWNLRRRISSSEVLEGPPTDAYAAASMSLLAVGHEVQSGLSDSDDDDASLPRTDPMLLDRDALLVLETSVPHSTKQERARFLAARNGDPTRATESLTSYIDWRSQYQSIPDHVYDSIPVSNDTDTNDWNAATATAQFAHDQLIVPLPRVVRIHSDAACRSGYKIMQILPAIMDDRLAGTHIYSLAIALYCDRKLKRQSVERLCVIVDVRSGFGWPNMALTGFISFAKHTIPLLLANFPERLGSAIVYPVPSMFGWVWRTISFFIDPETRKKFSLVSGANAKWSPPPLEQLQEFLEPDVIERLEWERRSSFTEDEL